MRVIAGTARSIPLVAPPGSDTRPTTDKIKETLFNMLQFDVQGSVFLDLFAGSGAIGTEALSRGAAKAVFVDNAKPAIEAIEANLKKCKFTDRAEVIRGDASRLSSYMGKIRTAEGQRLIVFMDPPYERGLEFPVLKGLSDSGILNEESLVIVEESLKCDMSEAAECGFTITRVKEYKNQKHVFLRKA